MNLQNNVTRNQRWRLRSSERKSMLIAVDLIMAVIAMIGSLYLWGISSDEWLGLTFQFLVERVPAWFYFSPVIWLLLMAELYEVHLAANFGKTIRGIFLAALIGLGIYAAIYFTSEPQSMPRSGVAYFLFLASVLTITWRWIYIRVFNAPAFMRRALVVGGGRAGTTLIDVVSKIDPAPFFIVGIIDDDPEKMGQLIDGVEVIANSDDLLETIAREDVSDLIVAITGRMKGKMFQALLDVQQSGVEISSMPVIYEELLEKVPIFHLESDWILRSFVDASRVGGFYIVIKRSIDILGGFVGTLMVLFFLPFVVLANLLETGFPIFYSQTRSGQNDREYEVIKFRTMVKDAEKDGQARWAQENDARVTMVGRFLRRTHLDELPQFINVLRGEMSLVGPRPERPQLIKMFQDQVPFYRARLLVKPGISGWAQIHQDYAASVDETNTKLEYDLFYIKNRSIWLDILILVRTPATMLGLRGR